jgi:hypothetical protein
MILMVAVDGINGQRKAKAMVVINGFESEATVPHLNHLRASMRVTQDRAGISQEIPVTMVVCKGRSKMRPVAGAILGQ